MKQKLECWFVSKEDEMTEMERELGKVLDSVPTRALMMFNSDCNYRSSQEYGMPFCELEAPEALPIAKEFLEVWKPGVAKDSITLAELNRQSRMLRKAAARVTLGIVTGTKEVIDTP